MIAGLTQRRCGRRSLVGGNLIDGGISSMRFAASLALCGALVLPAARSRRERGTAGADVPADRVGRRRRRLEVRRRRRRWFYGSWRARASRRTAGRSRWTRPTRRRSTSCRSSSAPRRRRRRPASAIILVALLVEGLAARPDRVLRVGEEGRAQTVNEWGIHDFIVWNEPNTRLYWSPQKEAPARTSRRPRTRRCSRSATTRSTRPTRTRT